MWPYFCHGTSNKHQSFNRNIVSYLLVHIQQNKVYVFNVVYTSKPKKYLCKGKYHQQMCLMFLNIKLLFNEYKIIKYIDRYFMDSQSVLSKNICKENIFQLETSKNG